jgi:hypothetical protein
MQNKTTHPENNIIIKHSKNDTHYCSDMKELYPELFGKLKTLNETFTNTLELHDDSKLSIVLSFLNENDYSIKLLITNLDLIGCNIESGFEYYEEEYFSTCGYLNFDITSNNIIVNMHTFEVQAKDTITQSDYLDIQFNTLSCLKQLNTFNNLKKFNDIFLNDISNMFKELNSIKKEKDDSRIKFNTERKKEVDFNRNFMRTIFPRVPFFSRRYTVAVKHIQRKTVYDLLNKFTKYSFSLDQNELDALDEKRNQRKIFTSIPNKSVCIVFNEKGNGFRFLELALPDITIDTIFLDDNIATELSNISLNTNYKLHEFISLLDKDIDNTVDGIFNAF